MDFGPLGTKVRLLTVNCIAIAVDKATAVPALGLDPQSSGFPSSCLEGLCTITQRCRKVIAYPENFGQ